MSQQSQSQEPQQEKQSKKWLGWIDERVIGPLIGALITAIAGGRIVILITGIQFNIGIMILVTLVLFVVMGISFFMGIGYVLFSFVGIFTKQQPPLVYRMMAKVMFIVIFPFLWKDWRIAQKNQQPPSETIEQMMERWHKERESKDSQQ